MDKPVALAADHGGLELKNHIKGFLQGLGVPTVDFGTNTADSTDYADYARPACEAVLRGECRTALLFCGTGIGMSMAANKMKGMRACACSETFSAELTRRHNDANALCLGGRVVGFGVAEKMVELFLNTPFEGGRHQTRIDKVAALEQP